MDNATPRPRTRATLEVDARHLPYWIRAIAQIAGLDAAMTLALEAGGTRIYIPQKASGSLLQSIVDVEAAEKICAEFGGERIEVPLVNNHLAVWLSNKGWSQEQIATRLRLCRRSVQYILSGKMPRRDPAIFAAGDSA